MYLASRSESKAAAAIAKINEENPKIKKGKLIWLPLDLSDLDKVHEAAQTFLAKEDRLDILGMPFPKERVFRGINAHFLPVNNAGMAAPTYQTTSDGFEVAMGVKYDISERP